MAQLQYCWRCQKDVPMLDEQEWAIVQPHLGLEAIKRYRQEHQASIAEAKRHCFNPALQAYFELTGYHEVNGDALLHHRLMLFGPPCEACGKPLRTPRARICAACGHECSTSSEEDETG